MNILCYSNFVKTWWNTLHLHFIPGVHNDHKPHFLRLKITAAILGVVIMTEGAYLAHTYIVLPHSDFFAAIFASALIDETNQSRVDKQLSQLTTNPILEKAAQLKANDMAAKGYFAHNTPDGKTPWYWFDQAGYNYAAAGENLAVNFTDSKDVTDAWLASPSHRANIMNGNYSEIGIATAQGTYKGKDAIFVVEEFGRPSLIARNTESASVSNFAPKDATTSDTTGTTSTAKNLATIKGASTTITQPVKVFPVKAVPKPLPLQAPIATTGSIATTSAQKPPQGEIAVTPVASSSVAGAETKRLNANVIISGPILERSRASVFDSIIASPRRTTSTLYLILAALLTLALGFAIFIKVRIQHPHIVANGMLLIAIILSLVMLNAALGFTQGVI